jgi:hypothetical protein
MMDAFSINNIHPSGNLRSTVNGNVLSDQKNRPPALEPGAGAYAPSQCSVLEALLNTNVKRSQ